MTKKELAKIVSLEIKKANSKPRFITLQLSELLKGLDWFFKPTPK